MSEALRLAEILTNLKFTVKGRENAEAMEKAAAELRRLHAEHTELGQALKRAIERNNELEALNAELVEALRGASNYIDVLGGNSKGYRVALEKVKASK